MCNCTVTMKDGSKLKLLMKEREIGQYMVDHQDVEQILYTPDTFKLIGGDDD